MLIDFIKTLDTYEEYESERKNVRIVTDDAFIINEMESVSQFNYKYKFMIPEPAPRRVPDKVFFHRNFEVLLNNICKKGRKRRSLQS